MLKKIISILLLATFIITAVPIASASGINVEITGVAVDGDDIVISIGNASGASHIDFTIHDNFNLVHEGMVPFDGSGQVRFTLFTQYLRPATYSFTAWGSDNTGINTGQMYSFELVLGRGHGGMYAGHQSDPDPDFRVAAIKTNQSAVFPNSSMTGPPTLVLRRYDRVYWQRTNNPFIFFVRGYLINEGATSTQMPDWRQGDEGGAQSGTMQAIAPGGTTFFHGYIYASTIRSRVFVEDITRNAVRLAQTRQGLHGMYSQSARNRINNVDCSFFVWWVYKEHGLALYNRTADSITGELYNSGMPMTTVWTNLNQAEIAFRSNAVHSPVNITVMVNGVLGLEPRTSDNLRDGTWTYRDANGAPVRPIQFPAGSWLTNTDNLQPGDLLSFIDPPQTIHYDWWDNPRMEEDDVFLVEFRQWLPEWEWMPGTSGRGIMLSNSQARFVNSNRRLGGVENTLPDERFAFANNETLGRCDCCRSNLRQIQKQWFNPYFDYEWVSPTMITRSQKPPSILETIPDGWSDVHMWREVSGADLAALDPTSTGLFVEHGNPIEMRDVVARSCGVFSAFAFREGLNFGVTHIGMYIGDGMMIHATNPYVTIAPVAPRLNRLVHVGRPSALIG